jgi:hypothetical protein
VQKKLEGAHGDDRVVPAPSTLSRTIRAGQTHFGRLLRPTTIASRR